MAFLIHMRFVFQKNWKLVLMGKVTIYTLNRHHDSVCDIHIAGVVISKWFNKINAFKVERKAKVRKNWRWKTSRLNINEAVYIIQHPSHNLCFDHKHENMRIVCNYVPLRLPNYYMWNIQIMKLVQFARYINFCNCTVKMTIRCVSWSLIFKIMLGQFLHSVKLNAFALTRPLERWWKHWLPPRYLKST